MSGTNIQDGDRYIEQDMEKDYEEEEEEDYEEEEEEEPEQPPVATLPRSRGDRGASDSKHPVDLTRAAAMGPEMQLEEIARQQQALQEQSKRLQEVLNKKLLHKSASQKAQDVLKRLGAMKRGCSSTSQRRQPPASERSRAQSTATTTVVAADEGADSTMIDENERNKPDLEEADAGADALRPQQETTGRDKSDDIKPSGEKANHHPKEPSTNAKPSKVMKEAATEVMEEDETPKQETFIHQQSERDTQRTLEKPGERKRKYESLRRVETRMQDPPQAAVAVAPNNNNKEPNHSASRSTRVSITESVIAEDQDHGAMSIAALRAPKRPTPPSWVYPIPPEPDDSKPSSYDIKIDAELCKFQLDRPRRMHLMHRISLMEVGGVFIATKLVPVLAHVNEETYQNVVSSGDRRQRKQQNHEKGESSGSATSSASEDRGMSDDSYEEEDCKQPPRGARGNNGNFSYPSDEDLQPSRHHATIKASSSNNNKKADLNRHSPNRQQQGDSVMIPDEEKTGYSSSTITSSIHEQSRGGNTPNKKNAPERGILSKALMSCWLWRSGCGHVRVLPLVLDYIQDKEREEM
uniref:Uncharacterized protein n=1 Tax=Grammatophora oceanica TaxID=210454 RepID=A0A7S1UXK7_9STRA|mmetsp:Transcript_28574/g.42076  ORF Transcript_28574/g.42076 Transcript_28574/m.42076 type:complete len:579 (+) Transcript_28574:202-1938(+)|eukprot:CAMPEP_0194029192 /NCGR_PEP_ID=MMETSP0009_2-20130614/2998_1 /TAXON_ID=210454 /ORGANISM="Grammatophora oceanica, Strain CCMP 410" /LENGTH=578 /DNA_ID=CAMNT_0038668799 /DNA_START=184 /DNA_END=1920 /DNA_ORIENTATION=+